MESAEVFILRIRQGGNHRNPSSQPYFIFFEITTGTFYNQHNRMEITIDDGSTEKVIFKLGPKE